MKAGAQRDARQVQSLLQRQTAARLGPAEQREAGARTVQAIERGDGDVGGIVLVAAERRAQLFLHPDDREFHTLDADELAEWRGLSGKQRGPHGFADHGHK